MSTFWGYMFEGSVFLIIWLWWLLNTYTTSMKCESSGKQFVPRLSYPWPGSKIPSETLFKLAASGTGFLATLFYDGVSLVDDHGNYRKMATVISMSIYGIFLLHSIAELLLWFGVPLIQNTDYVTAALGFFWYSLITYFRAQDFIHTSHVALMVTTLPTYPLLGIGVSLVLEMINPCSYWTQVMRVFCLGVVATWDMNAAFILHSAKPFPGADSSDWEMNSHSNTGFIGAAFGGHICLHLIFIILLYVVTSVHMRYRHGVRVQYKD
ncbi:hypothetical protein BsWGS_21865 [Bradybaena similaris]